MIVLLITMEDEGLFALIFLPFIFVFIILFVRDGLKYESLRKIEKNKNEIRKNELEKKLEIQRRNELQSSLLNQCGIKFFIKYYNVIKRLPLRDVEIDENYAPDERNERLSAVKKIIEENLTVLVIDNILENYGDILTEKELQNAKSIKKSLERDQ